MKNEFYQHYKERVMPALPNVSLNLSKPPNVLLILSDDHSAAHVGCYGNPDVKTPNLDALAAAGMRFNRAYVTAPQCVPSRASILTGRHPIDIGMTRFSAALPRDVEMFPETLRWPANVRHLPHVPPPDHPAFFCSGRLTLNGRFMRRDPGARSGAPIDELLHELRR